MIVLGKSDAVEDGQTFQNIAFHGHDVIAAQLFFSWP